MPTLAPNLCKSSFEARFGAQPRVFAAPGRVNLIGEHTDYNHGFVLPMAIRERTLVAAAPRPDSIVRAYAKDLDDERSFDLKRSNGPVPRGWLSYVEGVARTLVANGLELGGADLYITSEVPRGAGLSSSAALELAVALALCSLNGQHPGADYLAHIGQKAEHDFAGVKCGIMDQMVSAVAKRGHALLLDCRSLETKHVALPSAGTSWLLCDTGARHSHAVSGYNERRAECETIQRILEQKRGLQSLRDVHFAELPALEVLLPPLLFRRLRHVVTENRRTLAAVTALEEDAFDELGQLMLASHASLRDDFEVSCPELDLVVETASTLPGVLGARLTGGGFGGSVILLVETQQLAPIGDRVASVFDAEFGHPPELREVQPGPGMREELADGLFADQS